MVLRSEAQRSVLIVTAGPMSRQTRLFIEHAPVGMVIRVSTVGTKLRGNTAAVYILDEVGTWMTEMKTM